LLAAWHSETAPAKNCRSYLWDAIGLAAWFVMVALLMHKNFASALLLPFLVVIAYICVFRGKIFGFILTRPVFTTIGGMCYTIYLYHPFLKSGLKHLLFPLRVSHLYALNSLFQVFALGSVIVLVAAIGFLLFEKPFMLRDWPFRFSLVLKRLTLQWTAQESASPLPFGKTDGQQN
jgi:peptidoglycan/LPS O-acetylase OafA/YrhL